MLAGKAARFGMRALGSGGTALPGLVVERLDADAAGRLAQRLSATALITGTNGKTTTAAMLARILRVDGRAVIHNSSGSNLMRGVTASLVAAASPLGTLPAGCTAVLETDEAALPAIARAAPPSVAVFTNLMRDQLDRYGEIDSIALRWADALKGFPENATIALNVDDPLIASLASGWSGKCLRFGIEDPNVPPAPEGEIVDAVWDPVTRDDFRYSRRYFAQLGRWYTDSGAQRPTPEIAADQIAYRRSVDAVRIASAGRIHVHQPPRRGSLQRLQRVGGRVSRVGAGGARRDDSGWLGATQGSLRSAGSADGRRVAAYGSCWARIPRV